MQENILSHQQEKYINLFTDFGFKRIFGKEIYKEVLIDFLNQIIENETITDLSYINNQRQGITEDNRKAIFDIVCKNEEGEYFIVEIQQSHQEFFVDRMIFYSSFLIQEQAKSGNWDYQLKAVYTIGILKFAFAKQQSPVEEDYYWYAQLIDKRRNSIFSEKLHYICLEMPKFTKKLTELETRKDKWLFLIKNLHTLDRVPEELKDEIIMRVFSLAEIAEFNPAERIAYEASKHDVGMEERIAAFAEKKGREKGMAEGIEKGIEKGKKEIDGKLLKKGLSIEDIADSTDLSIEEIKALAKK